MRTIGILTMILGLALCCDVGAQSCVTHSRVVVRDVYQPVVVSPVLVTPIATAIQFIPVPLVIPTYTVGIQQQLGQPGQAVGDFAQELRTLRQEIATLRGGAPVPQQQPQPQAQAQQGAQGAQSAPHVGVMVRNCASCHDRSVASGKGRGIVLTDGDRLAELAAETKLRVILQIHENKMPPGKKLNDQDYSEIVVGLSSAKQTAATP